MFVYTNQGSWYGIIDDEEDDAPLCNCIHTLNYKFELPESNNPADGVISYASWFRRVLRSNGHVIKQTQISRGGIIYSTVRH